MKKDLISVIIPLYNTEQYIERCIKSIVQNTYKNLEIIVVDDGSKDNSVKIVNELIELYDNVKLVSHDINKGLFQARITGLLASEGEYIAYVDADDYVTCDWFRLLHKTITENNADIAIGQFILDNDKYGKSYNNLDLLRQKIDFSGDDVIKAFMTQRGTYYSWQLVWNKLYRRTIWEDAVKDLQSFSDETPRLVMCEDMAFSTAIWCRAKKVNNFTTGAYYYYFIHEGQSTQIVNDKVKNTKNIINVGCVFRFMHSQLEKAGLLSIYKKDLEEWKLDYANKYYNQYVNYGKKYYTKLLTEHFKLTIEDITKERPFNVMYTVNTPVRNDVFSWELELKNLICDENIDVVSFDIFDTLVVRPFAKPIDLLKLLNAEFLRLFDIKSYYDFSNIRVVSEFRARTLNSTKLNSLEEITLDDIYEQIHSDYGFDSELLNQLKLREQELEIEFCSARGFAKQLFELAKQQGKKIFITSDMYLSRSVIEKILEKNGYSEYNELFISSEVGLTKHSKNLFRYIFKNTGYKPQKILHIGDSWESDVENPQALGMKSFHLPKTTDILYNYHPAIYGGRILGSQREFSDVHDLNDIENYFIGYSALIGLIANKLFDNPYVYYNPWSDFNADPFVIGYAALGPYLYAVTDWIRQTAAENGASKIHFVARDGYLPMQAFELFKKFYTLPNTNYLYVSRKSMIFSDIYTSNDIYSLTYKMYATKYTPRKLIKAFSPYLPDDLLSAGEEKILEAIDVCKNIAGVSFASQVAFEKAAYALYNLCDSNKIERYKKLLKEYFASTISEGDMLFDIGYSGRQELSLSEILGFPINSMYLHSNNDILNYRSLIGGFQTKLFYEYKPRITGVMREHLFMKLAPSATGYVEVDGKLEPEFEKFNIDTPTMLITNTVQEAALQFVNDFLSIFHNHIDNLYYRKDDFAYAFEYYLHHSKYDDKKLFGGLMFEDDLGTGKKIKALDFWNNECASINRVPHASVDNYGGVYEKRSFARKCADVFLPKGTRRREFVKKIYHGIRKDQT